MNERGGLVSTWIDVLERSGWAAFVVDQDWRLAWVSDEQKEFIRATGDDAVGVGKHVMEALTQDVWLSSVTPESQLRLFQELVPFIIHDHERRAQDLPPFP